VRRALCVGIDAYPGTPLYGCVADAKAVGALLARNGDGSLNFEVSLLTSDVDVIDRPGLRQALIALFENARDAELVFYFSGHGAQTPWGGELVTVDFAPNTLGVSMGDLLTLATLSPARQITMILDCCFSGDLGNPAELQTDPSPLFARSLIRDNTILLAASRPTEAAMEDSGHGTFTRLLLEGLEGAAGDHLGHVTALSLYAFASRSFGAWDQRPVLKAHLTEALPLREVNPPIDQALLRELPELFASADTVIQLSPEYEGVRPGPSDAEPTAEQAQFDRFKLLRNAGLLETPDHADLYFAAMDGGTVVLTAIGKYFWRLAASGRL
jgi:hypothetical protein